MPDLPPCPEGRAECAFSRHRFDGGCIHYWRDLSLSLGQAVNRATELAAAWDQEREDDDDRVGYYFDKGGDTDEAETVGHLIACSDHAAALRKALAGDA